MSNRLLVDPLPCRTGGPPNPPALVALNLDDSGPCRDCGAPDSLWSRPDQAFLCGPCWANRPCVPRLDDRDSLELKRNYPALYRRLYWDWSVLGV